LQITIKYISLVGKIFITICKYTTLKLNKLLTIQVTLSSTCHNIAFQKLTTVGDIISKPKRNCV